MTPLRAAALLLALAAGTHATAALAQPRPATFNCIGAEELEDDVFAIPFPTGRDSLTDAARTPLAAAVDLLKREPDRNACILGHARREGGQQTSVQLAARRARATKDALRAAGLPEARLRSEARVAGFSRTTGNTVARSVSLVVMPARSLPPERAPAAPAAEPATPREAPRPGTAPRTEPRPEPRPEPRSEPPARETTPPPAPPPAEAPPPRETTRPPAPPPAEAPPRETTPPPARPPAEPPPRETVTPPPAAPPAPAERAPEEKAE